MALFYVFRGKKKEGGQEGANPQQETRKAGPATTDMLKESAFAPQPTPSYGYSGYTIKKSQPSVFINTGMAFGKTALDGTSISISDNMTQQQALAAAAGVLSSGIAKSEQDRLMSVISGFSGYFAPSQDPKANQENSARMAQLQTYVQNYLEGKSSIGATVDGLKSIISGLPATAEEKQNALKELDAIKDSPILEKGKQIYEQYKSGQKTDAFQMACDILNNLLGINLEGVSHGFAKSLARQTDDYLLFLRDIAITSGKVGASISYNFSNPSSHSFEGSVFGVARASQFFGIGMGLTINNAPVEAPVGRGAKATLVPDYTMGLRLGPAITFNPKAKNNRVTLEPIGLGATFTQINRAYFTREGTSLAIFPSWGGGANAFGSINLPIDLWVHGELGRQKVPYAFNAGLDFIPYANEKIIPSQGEKFSFDWKALNCAVAAHAMYRIGLPQRDGNWGMMVHSDYSFKDGEWGVKFFGQTASFFRKTTQLTAMLKTAYAPGLKPSTTVGAGLEVSPFAATRLGSAIKFGVGAETDLHGQSFTGSMKFRI